MRVKRLQISGELLKQALRIPENATIVQAKPGHALGDVEFVVECEQFPEVGNGEIIPFVTGQITETKQLCGCRNYSWEWIE